MAYIKMQDVMKICEGYSQHCFDSNDARGQDIADRIEDDIVKIPTADVVEVVHGEWIVVNHIGNSKKGRHIRYSTKKCSVCGYCNGRRKTQHCPNCGAKMDGGKI